MLLRKMRIKRILVPLDGSETADSALSIALNLAEKTGSHIELLNIVPLYVMPSTLTPNTSYAWIEEYLEKMKSSNEKMLSEALKKAKTAAPNIIVSKKMLEGRPASKIVKEAKKGEFDLITMGSSGLGGFSRIILGSVSNEVSHLSEVPVMFAKSRDTNMLKSFNKILIAIDGSENSKRAQEFGLEIAEAFNAEVELLNIVSIGVENIPVLPYPMKPIATYTVPGWVQPYSSEYLKESEDFLSKSLENARKTKPNLTISKKIIEGKPANEILKASKEGKYDLIVLGSVGLGNVGSIFLGSISSKVVNNSEIPVILVK
jgi:nucleotide-binding universal stress UspA family protein